MRKLISTLLFCISCFSNGLFGQDQLPTIIPPSPEASSIAKFTEVPISHYTGLPNISIPIYTISQSGINIPISLNYHARGIQVSEVAPRVGLGWALNYGGSISRQTRGIADEDGGYGYLNNDYLTNFFSSSSKRNSVWSLYSNHNEYDFTPDLFHFSAGGISGKFVFDQISDGVIVQEFDDIKVEYSIASAKITAFQVTDASGFKYYYGVSKNGARTARNEDEIIENVEYVNGQSPAISSPSTGRTYSAWQLMDIESPNGELISYTYELETSVYYRRSYDKYDNTINKFISYSSKVRSHQYQLSEITFKQGKLEFVPSTIERQDLEDAYVLDHINLYDSKNSLIKSYELSYEYTTSSSNNNQLAYLKNADPKSNKRLFLKSVTETDGNNSLPGYQFDYNSNLLPNRFSNSQDVWGYFNGANNGSYLSFFTYTGSAVDRTIDTTKSEAGLLKKITYPTGGTSDFIYEHNKAASQDFYSTIAFHAMNPPVSREEGLSPLEYSLFFNSSTNTYEKSFTIDQSIIGSVSAMVSITDTSCTSGSAAFPCKFDIWVTDGSSSYPLYETENGTVNLSLSAGNYTLKIKPKNHTHDPFNQAHFFNVILSWTEQMASPDDYIYGPGKRIKEIVNKSNGVVVGTKTYEYEDGSGNSSGTIFGLPNFYAITQSIGTTSILAPYGATPGSPLSIPQGNSIGYSRVTEYNGDQSGNIGKTVYTFTDHDDSGSFHTFPYTLPTDNEWLRGKPIDIEYYKNEGGGYSLIRKISHEYLYADYLDGSTSNHSPFVPFTITSPLASNLNNQAYTYLKNKKKIRLPLIVFGYDDQQSVFNYKTYHFTAGTLDLLKTTDTEYFDNQTSYSTITTYGYDYDDHYQLASSEVTDSKGDTYKTLNYYPGDVGESQVSNYSSSVLNSLNNANRKSTLIQSDSYKNSTLLSRVRNNYKSFTNGPLELETVTFAKGSGSLETRVRYHAYNVHGNPLMVSQENGMKIVYLWGYNGAVPVAKIENAELSDVQAIINQSVLNNPTSDSALRTELNKLRNDADLAQALITTMTYKRGIGVSSITTPNGLTTYYEYDGFGRLKYVRDKDNNILKKNEYAYKVNASNTGSY